MTICRRMLAVLLSLSLPACTGPDLLNAFVPRTGFKVDRDLAYGDGPRQRLDLYRPADTTAPLVVFLYGGGWESGSRGDYFFVGEALASRGYAVAIPDYRLFPEVRYPSFLQDAAAAVAWVHARASRLGVRPGPVYLVGHSAGAYIAAMLSLDRRWLEADGLPVCGTIAAAVGLAGPYDFLPLDTDVLKAIFGPESAWPDTQPINHVDGSAPPLLLVTGQSDSTVRPRNSTALATRIRDAGGSVEERSYRRTGHVALVAALARPLRWLAPTLDDIDSFLRRHPTDAPADCPEAGGVRPERPGPVRGSSS